ncbi:uncharacterized protein LOC111717271 [Eurytemora carolleeae]|uniref:uncharacterized protein LOC111717271 n=1 Tax=Eurytemora carolleeae TaxID=1294199 RepID=UPI000C76D81F|nr:uncharacterized protein LOC111717271 [Eurytemora carolleeae]|eukprot:XP_023348545.1 uncharacterized protein LOC111717271 [Eurytemora affinis]
MCSRIQVGILEGLCSEEDKTGYIQRANHTGKELVDLLYQYSKNNLALVNVYIKKPVVTKIKRDQKIPVIWFVANSGGILGLCMGFSMVTVFELVHYMLVCLWNGITNEIKREEKFCCSLVGKPQENTEEKSCNLELSNSSNGNIFHYQDIQRTRKLWNKCCLCSS